MCVWSSQLIEERCRNSVRSRIISEANKWILVDFLIGLCFLIELKLKPLFYLLDIPITFAYFHRSIGYAVLVILCISVTCHIVRIFRVLIDASSSGGLKKVNAWKPAASPLSPLGRSQIGPTMFGPPLLNESIDTCSKWSVHGTSLLHPESSPQKSSPFLNSTEPSGSEQMRLTSSPYSQERAPSVFSLKSPNSCSPRNVQSLRSSSGSSVGAVSLLDIALSPITNPITTSGTSCHSEFECMFNYSPNFSVGTRSATWASPLFGSFQTPHYQYQLSVTPQSDSGSNQQRTYENALRYGLSEPNILDGKFHRSADREPHIERSPEEYWNEHKIALPSLDQWTVDLRKWLHGTILRRLVDEIGSANKYLSETVGEDAIIGATTLTTLEQLCSSKYQYLPTLTTLLSFLDFTKDQGYLVNRIQELARGGCLEEFRWDAGSRSSSWPWKEHLPNDSLILLHLFAAYMDTRMPPHPRCLNGRVFSQLYVVRHPDKPDMKSKYSSQIYQVSVQPPHFKLVLNGKIYAFPPGPKNLYHVILMFFYNALKVDGNLRSISLGPSGLNVGWIFSKQ
ncbi:unnamed protein product [Calicophoron daubneyi]|uniref:Transmembrane protein 209 n=1 Tax=Calicophoron daubneyi TaxID=300641 RepID=A0AAV2U0W4_CALDB